MLSELSYLKDVTLQTSCYSNLELPGQLSSRSAKRQGRKPSRVWRLNVIIYGTVVLEDAVGPYLSKHRMYLQDPVDCERNVLYRNPHMISKGGEMVMTDSFKSQLSTIEIERLSVGPDLLAQLMAEQTPLPEIEPPPTVTTTLFRYWHHFHSQAMLLTRHKSHQKQALTFMARRELGWNLKSDEDIWTEEHSPKGCHRWHSSSPLRSIC